MPFLGEIAALSAAILWGGTTLAFESAGHRVGAFATNLWRIVFGLIFLCAALFFTTGKIFPVHATGEQFMWLGLSGIVGLAIGDGALFACLVILGARRATLLLSLAPAIATVLAWIFLDEHLGIMALTGIALTLAGIYWVMSEKNVPDKVHGSLWLGILTGVLAALGQAVGVILVKFGFRTEIDALSATILRMAPAAIVLWLAGVVVGRGPALLEVMRDRRVARVIVIASVSGPFLGVWLSIIAVKYTAAGIASTLLATVPIVVIPIIIIVQKTVPSLRAILGTFLALVGIAFIFLR